MPPTRALRRSVVPLCALVLAGACTPYAATPALRTVPLDTVETMRPEHAGVSLATGAHTTELYTASARVRYGLVEDVELQLEGSWAYVPPLERSGRDLSPHAGAGRAGVKHRVLDWLAFTGGLGAGSGPWGAYLGLDLGTVFAYENPYVVPFYAIRVQLAGPVDPQTERLVETNADGTSVVTLLTPATTLYFQNATGIRIPICAECEGVRGSLTAAFAWTQLYAPVPDRTETALGGELGLEIEL